MADAAALTEPDQAPYLHKHHLGLSVLRYEIRRAIARGRAEKARSLLRSHALLLADRGRVADPGAHRNAHRAVPAGG
jgi:hypothetical protein